MGKGARLELALEKREREPVFIALSRSIILEIERGRLKPGDPLPGTRSLARSLKLNRHTVDAAYHELDMQGWLKTEPSKGTFVADLLPKNATEAETSLPEQSISFDPHTKKQRRTELSDGSADVRLLPAVAFAQSFRRALSVNAFTYGGSYGDPAGSPVLRKELSKYLGEERGLVAGPEQILITRGSQMALYLAAAAVAEKPGYAIAVECPGYSLAWAAFRAVGLAIIGIPVDDEGIDTNALEMAARNNPNLRAIYLTPHHQYPTTVTLSAARRLQILDLARRRSIVVIEDDYDNEYRFDGSPILPLAYRAEADLNVIYLGSLSKLLAPGIRVGYAVAPYKYLKLMKERRETIDRQGDLPLEYALAELIADGTLRRHTRKARKIYRTRRDYFASLLTEKLSEFSEFTIPKGGLAIWLRMKEGVSAELWARNACRSGISVLPARGFELETRPPPEAFRLGYANFDESELERIVDILTKTTPKPGGRR